MWQMDEFSNGMALDRYNRLCDVYPFGTHDEVDTVAAAEPRAEASMPKTSSRPSQVVLALATVFFGVGTSICATALYYLI